MATPTSSTAQPPSPTAARLLHQIASDQSAAAGSISARMCAAYAAEIPAYQRISDPALVDDVRSVSEALVRLWLDMMCSGRSLTQEELIPLVEGARRRATQGIDLYSLLRAYRVGLRVMWHELMSAPEWRRRSLQAVMGHLAELALDFAERTSTEIAAAYVDELARLAREREQRRSALLDVILAGLRDDGADGPLELRGPHAVVVANVAEGLPLERLEAIGSAVEAALGATLWTVRHRSVIATAPLRHGEGREWLLRELLAHVSPPGVLAIGVGGNACNAFDSRQSYAEAVEALRVGPLLVTHARAVYDFQEFAPAIALLAQPEQARRFVATAFEPLGDLAERAWLVPTLEAYISRQGRLKEAASHLGVHLNTVKYRLNEVRETVGPLLANGDRATVLLLALRLRRVLHASVEQAL